MASDQVRLLNEPTQLDEEQTAQAKLRAAIYDGIGEADVAEIVRETVARAKKGDQQSLKWVFDYFLGAQLTPAKVENHLHVECHDEDSARRLISLQKHRSAK